MSILKFDPWVTSSVPGFTEFGYRKNYATGKGEARYSTLLRSNLSISNKNFDTFTNEIDSLKSWEKSIIIDSTVVGLLQSLIKLKDGLTWASVVNLGKN